MPAIIWKCAHEGRKKSASIKDLHLSYIGDARKLLRENLYAYAISQACHSAKIMIIYAVRTSTELIKPEQTFE